MCVYVRGREKEHARLFRNYTQNVIKLNLITRSKRCSWRIVSKKKRKRRTKNDLKTLCIMHLLECVHVYAYASLQTLFKLKRIWPTFRILFRFLRILLLSSSSSSSKVLVFISRSKCVSVPSRVHYVSSHSSKVMVIALARPSSNFICRCTLYTTTV